MNEMGVTFLTSTRFPCNDAAGFDLSLSYPGLGIAPQEQFFSPGFVGEHVEAF